MLIVKESEIIDQELLICDDEIANRLRLLEDGFDHESLLPHCENLKNERIKDIESAKKKSASLVKANETRRLNKLANEMIMPYKGWLYDGISILKMVKLDRKYAEFLCTGTILTKNKDNRELRNSILKVLDETY